MGKAAATIPADKLACYEKLVATVQQLERKGAAVPYTSCNGHMFSYLSTDGTLGLRLPAGEREAFLKQYKTRLCVNYGVVMKEYVAVPDALLRSTRLLQRYFAISLAYVRGLKPKPTTRKKAKKQ
ncbi:MAG TPA: hypothetical protein VK348_15010 [Planctomycetota bacterium]|nr:hypothetical protein [Planctomycetota bacterium]